LTKKLFGCFFGIPNCEKLVVIALVLKSLIFLFVRRRDLWLFIQ